VVEEIRAAGGEIYGITSEPHSLASEAEDAWGISIPVIGDPHHEIREDLKARGWLDIFYKEDYGHLRDRSWASHPKGYFQPAIIAIDENARVLYRWRLVPKLSNIAGAGARPESRYAWERIQAAISSTGDADLDVEPVLTEKDPPWPVSLLILTANGWFIRPKALPLTRDGREGFAGVPRAIRRAFAFFAAWIVALVLFPAQWVAVAALVWAVIVTPGMIEIHRQFQHEPDP
jgi:hypothetical protein